MSGDYKEFISALHENIRYWSNQKDRNDLEKLEGCTFSILVMLDGMSGSFKGDIHTISHFHGMLHDQFYI